MCIHACEFLWVTETFTDIAYGYCSGVPKKKSVVVGVYEVLNLILC